MRSLDWLNAANEDDFVAALANMFEHSPWIARGAFKDRPFSNLAGLRDSLLNAASTMPADRRMSFIRAHPDLANKVQRAEGLTADSVAEQDGAGLDRLSGPEMERFQALNAAYKAKFGFPFILCARRHTKDSILDQFSRRLEHSCGEEEQTAFSEIRKIATLRLAQLVNGPDALPVYGELSVHVESAVDRKPIEGVSVELIELSRWGESRRLAAMITNRNGTTDRPLIHERPIPIGAYEIQFGSLQRESGKTGPSPLDVIPVRLHLSKPEGQSRVRVSVGQSRYEVDFGD